MDRTAQRVPAPVVKIDRAHAAGAVALHALAALAPFAFSWSGLAVAVVLYGLTAIGVSVGHHRLFAHKSFVAVRSVRWLFGVLGALALQGGPLRWCALHRLHHAHADEAGDPQHSGAGFWRAHIGWVALSSPDGAPWSEHPVVDDLRREPFLRFLEAAHVPLNFLFAGVMFTFAWVVGGWALASSVVVWGAGVRVVALWHATLVVNSVAHRWGRRNYPTPDNSRNVWWLLPLSLGECWHNNHHAQPDAAAHGHRWYELDPSAAVIRVLGWLGLATEIVRLHVCSPRAAPDRSRLIRS